MPFTDAEKERVRYHLGYLNVSPAASIQMGIPKMTQTNFLLEQAMGVVLETGIDRCRRILGILDAVEEKLVCAQDRLAAISVADIKLRETEPDLLEREYSRWGNRLAEQLGVPAYPFSQRYQQGMGTRAGNIPVLRS